MRVVAENLGYRELERLGQFLIDVANKEKYYNRINLWNELCYEYIEIGYSTYYDEGYITNECNSKYYESDFE